MTLKEQKNKPTIYSLVDNEKWYNWDDNSVGVFKKGKKGLKLGTIVPNGIKEIEGKIKKTEKIDYVESTNEDGSITYQELDANGNGIKRQNRSMVLN